MQQFLAFVRMIGAPSGRFAVGHSGASLVPLASRRGTITRTLRRRPITLPLWRRAVTRRRLTLIVSTAAVGRRTIFAWRRGSALVGAKRRPVGRTGRTVIARGRRWITAGYRYGRAEQGRRYQQRTHDPSPLEEEEPIRGNPRAKRIPRATSHQITPAKAIRRGRRR